MQPMGSYPIGQPQACVPPPGVPVVQQPGVASHPQHVTMTMVPGQQHYAMTGVAVPGLAAPMHMQQAGYQLPHFQASAPMMVQAMGPPAQHMMQGHVQAVHMHRNGSVQAVPMTQPRPQAPAPARGMSQPMSAEIPSQLAAPHAGQSIATPPAEESPAPPQPQASSAPPQPQASSAAPQPQASPAAPQPSSPASPTAAPTTTAPEAPGGGASADQDTPMEPADGVVKTESEPAPPGEGAPGPQGAEGDKGADKASGAPDTKAETAKTGASRPSGSRPKSKSKKDNKKGPAVNPEEAARILPKSSLKKLLASVAKAGEKMDEDLEDALLKEAGGFLEGAILAGCTLARRRQSDTLEPRDIALHLERQFHLPIPGYSGGDQLRSYKRPAACEIHAKRHAAVRKSRVNDAAQQEKQQEKLLQQQQQQAAAEAAAAANVALLPAGPGAVPLAGGDPPQSEQPTSAAAAAHTAAGGGDD